MARRGFKLAQGCTLGFPDAIGLIQPYLWQPSFALYVTESGFSDGQFDGRDDAGRVNYYVSYINEMLQAVLLDGCNVKAYTRWSLMDNFEWAAGYS